VQGYYKTKESELSFLSTPFHDLASSIVKKSLSENQKNILSFSKKWGSNCRFILLLQTHAESNGGLLYGPKKSTDLLAILTYVLEGLTLHDFSNSVLFINACGSLVESYEMQLSKAATNYGFKSVFAPTGTSVDPLLVATNLFYNVIDFHIIGNESTRKSLERSACVPLLSIASVMMWSSGRLYRLCGASLRFRPNGTPVFCPTCGRCADYFKLLKDGKTVIFRCKSGLHPGNNTRFAIALLQPNDKIAIVGGAQARCRYIVTEL
ncbi:hypothetical protein AX14_011835, partial [Amanita brunnescens Koide BX004]